MCIYQKLQMFPSLPTIYQLWLSITFHILIVIAIVYTFIFRPKFSASNYKSTRQWAYIHSWEFPSVFVSISNTDDGQRPRWCTYIHSISQSHQRRVSFCDRWKQWVIIRKEWENITKKDIACQIKSPLINLFHVFNDIAYMIILLMLKSYYQYFTNDSDFIKTFSRFISKAVSKI